MSNLDASSIARWRKHPAKFIEEVLVDYETGRPFRLLPAQREFFRYAFKTRDDGRLLYPEQVFGAPKKSGKTGFGAMHLLTTTVVYGGRYAEGYALANDLEQASGRVFEACRRIVEQSPLLRDEAAITQRQIKFSNGACITALPSDYAGAAGGHPTISSFDELWAFTTERSQRLWDEMVPVPTKKISCRLTTTYAGFEGESVLLESLYKRGLQQPEVAPNLYAGDGLLMFWSHEPIAPWQNEEWLRDMRASMRPNAYARMIENRFVNSDSPLIDMGWFDECVQPDLRPTFIDHRLPVWVGVDASVKRDSTAIAVVTWDRPKGKARLATHYIFQPSQEQHIDFEEQVEATIYDLKKRFNVKQVLYDPYQMQASAQRLIKAGVKMEEYPQSVPNITQASQNLYELIKSRALELYPDDQIRLAFNRAIAVETNRGWRIDKAKQSHKIDIVVAMGMACWAATQVQGKAYDFSYSWVDGNDKPYLSSEEIAYRQRMKEKGVRMYRVGEGIIT